MIKLTANLTAASDFVQELVSSPGRYKVIADPARFKADSPLLIRAASQQFAQGSARRSRSEGTAIRRSDGGGPPASLRGR